MNRTLISLSLVTTIWNERKKDYLDTFIPFIATLIYKKDIKSIKENEVQNICDLFYEEFYLKIPVHPMIAILNKCRHEKLLKKKDGEYIFDKNNILEKEFSKEEKSLLKKQEVIIKKFIDFSNNYKKSISYEDATEIILNYLKKNDIEILFANHFSSTIPKVKMLKRYKQYFYILNKYIANLYENEVELYNYLCDISLGHIISNTILLDNYFDNETVKNCNIFIDTPLILHLIEASGENKKNAIDQLLKSLRSKKAKLKLFKHTYHEVLELLENSVRWLDNIDFDPCKASKATLFFRHEGYSKDKVERIINNMDTIINENSIEILDLVDIERKSNFGIDVDLLKKMIDDTYLEYNPYYNKNRYNKRTLRDIDSISIIYQLRKNNEPRYLRDAKYVMMTDNYGLVSANRKYNIEKKKKERELFACLTDVFIGTIVWLQSPKEAKYECRQKMIADCHAAINPDPYLEKKLLYEAKNLKKENKINENEFILLTTTHLTKNLLSEKTIGDPDQFTSKTPVEILDNLRNEYQSDLIQKGKVKDVKINEVSKQKKIYKSGFDDIIIKIANITSCLYVVIFVIILLLGIIAPIVLILAYKLNWFFLIISLIFTILSTCSTFIKENKLCEVKKKIYFSVIKKLKKEFLKK